MGEPWQDFLLNTTYRSWPHFYAYVQPAGDIDGDGVGDFIHHLVFDEWPYAEVKGTFINYWHIMSVRQGSTGAELWRHVVSEPYGDAHPRDLAAVVIADGAQGRGRVLVYEWFRHGYGLANVTTVRLTVFGGGDGTTLWQVENRAAAADLDLLYRYFLRNGLPDLDADGIADPVVIDRGTLPDLTPIHEFLFVSGYDAESLGRITLPGTFALVSAPFDVSGDGIGDLVAISGDPMDLWLTVYDADGLVPIWSNHAYRMRGGNYLSLKLMVDTMRLEDTNRTEARVLLNVHGFVTRFEHVREEWHVVPKMVVYGEDGAARWVMPRGPDDPKEGFANVAPVGAQFEAAVDRDAPPVAYSVLTPTVANATGVVTFALGAVSVFVLGRRGRK